MEPISSILLWQFQRDFLNAPQQSIARFANRVSQELMTAENQFQDIIPQVDGLDYDPNDVALKFRPLPMLQFTTERVGFQKYSHTWNYALATEDLARIQPAFRMQLPRLARESWERFKDRVLAGKSDGTRLTQTDSNLGTQTKTFLPDKYKYAIKKGITDTELDTLNLAALIDLSTSLYASEIYDPMTGQKETPIIVASHAQIHGLLKVDKIVNRDYNTQLALTRGDINSFMGFEFVRTDATGKFKAEDGIYVDNTGTSVETSKAAVAGKTHISSGEKILCCHPKAAFAMGIYPQAGYMHVWQNPNRSGALEYYFKNTISWKRKQNEYVRMAYAKSAAVGTEPGLRKTPVKGARYHDNTDGNTTWDYANTV